jgi:hypothetical protein
LAFGQFTPSIKAQKSLNGLIWLLVMEQTEC